MNDDDLFDLNFNDDDLSELMGSGSQDSDDTFGDFGDSNNQGWGNNQNNSSNNYGAAAQQNSGQSYEIDGFDTDFSGQSEDDGFGDLADREAQGKRDTKKTSLIMIVIGILVIVCVFGGIKVVQNIKNRSANASGKAQVETTEKSGGLTEKNKGSNEVPANSSAGSTVINSSVSDDWIEFSTSSDISFNKEYMQSTFSVTAIKHYVKVIDNSNNIELKTVLYGALAGFTGTYELEIPYSKGSKLNIGDYFTVSVQIGSMPNGKTIIGDIKY